MKSRVGVAAHSNHSTQEVKTENPWSKVSSYANQMHKILGPVEDPASGNVVESGGGRPLLSRSHLRAQCCGAPAHMPHTHMQKGKEMPAGTWPLLLLDLFRFPAKEHFFFPFTT